MRRRATRAPRKRNAPPHIRHQRTASMRMGATQRAAPGPMSLAQMGAGDHKLRQCYRYLGGTAPTEASGPTRARQPLP
eukprot:scaffold31970_cov31-Tisochrysis_lutea.AAC.7